SAPTPAPDRCTPGRSAVTPTACSPSEPISRTKRKSMIRPRVLALAALSGALLITAGCGTTEQPGSSTPDGEGGPVTVTDGRGKTINLDAPAQRVVGLEWGDVEMLVTLGVMPVGV